MAVKFNMQTALYNSNIKSSEWEARCNYNSPEIVGATSTIAFTYSFLNIFDPIPEDRQAKLDLVNLRQTQDAFLYIPWPADDMWGSPVNTTGAHYFKILIKIPDHTEYWEEDFDYLKSHEILDEDFYMDYGIAKIDFYKLLVQVVEDVEFLSSYLDLFKLQHFWLYIQLKTNHDYPFPLEYFDTYFSTEPWEDPDNEYSGTGAQIVRENKVEHKPINFLIAPALNKEDSIARIRYHQSEQTGDGLKFAFTYHFTDYASDYCKLDLVRLKEKQDVFLYIPMDENKVHPGLSAHDIKIATKEVGDTIKTWEKSLQDIDWADPDPDVITYEYDNDIEKGFVKLNIYKLLTYLADDATYFTSYDDLMNADLDMFYFYIQLRTYFTSSFTFYYAEEYFTEEPWSDPSEGQEGYDGTGIQLVWQAIYKEEINKPDIQTNFLVALD